MRHVEGNSGAGGGLSGDFLLKKGGWYSRRLGGAGETIFRVMPYFDPESGAEQPQIEIPRTEEYHPLEVITKAFAQYYTVKFYGDKKYNMLTEITDPIEGVADPITTVNRVLYNYCKNNRKQAPDNWYNWFFPTEGYPSVTKPKPMLYVKGYLTTLNGEVVMRNNEPAALYPTVLQISQKSAEQELFTGMLTPVDTAKELSAENSIIGDITSCARGRMLVFKATKRQNEQTKKMQTYMLVEAGEEYPLDIGLTKKLYEPWEEIMLLPTTEFLLERLCETLGADAVHFALENTPYSSRLPELARSAAAPATTQSAAKPAAPAPRPPAPQAPAPRPSAPPAMQGIMKKAEVSYNAKAPAPRPPAIGKKFSVVPNLPDAEELRKRLQKSQEKVDAVLSPGDLGELADADEEKED